MKTQMTLGRRIWLPVSIAAATLALQFMVYAACNKAGNTVDCTTATTCSATSPNCGVVTNYDGTVSSKGSRRTITAAGYNEDGKTGSTQPSNCVYTCKITSDCTGQSPEKDIQGSAHVDPDGSSCKGQ